MAEGGNEFFGVREPCNTAGEILPVPPLIKEGTQKPPYGKGAARSARGFGNVAVMKRTFASSIAMLAPSSPTAMLRAIQRAKHGFARPRRERGSRTPK